MVNFIPALSSWSEVKDSAYICKCILEADGSVLIDDPAMGVSVIKAISE